MVVAVNAVVDCIRFSAPDDAGYRHKDNIKLHLILQCYMVLLLHASGSDLVVFVV